VLAVLSETEWVGLTDEQLSELVASAT